MTRQGYLRLLAIELVLVFGVMAAGVLAMVRGHQLLPDFQAPQAHLRDWFWQQLFVALFWLCLLGLLLQLIETALVLKRFARAETEEKAKTPADAKAANAPTDASTTP
jgi:hypothetical protein